MRSLLVAAGLVGCSAWVATGAGPGQRRLADFNRPSQPPAQGRVPVRTGLLLTGGVGVGAVLALTLRSPVPVLVAPLLGYGLRRWRRAAARSAAAASNRAAVVELCAALAAELRAGRPPVEALSRAPVGDRPAVAGRALAAAGRGGDLVAALRADADQQGAEALRRLAACWQVAQGRGAGLATAVERLGDGLRSEEAHRREVAAELAGPRATARILAVLPLLGLLMGAGFGARPLDVLLRSPHGMAALLAGAVLVAAGLLWTERISRAAEAAP